MILMWRSITHHPAVALSHRLTGPLRGILTCPAVQALGKLRPSHPIDGDSGSLS
jgi:hypothetical protein